MSVFVSKIDVDREGALTKAAADLPPDMVLGIMGGRAETELTGELDWSSTRDLILIALAASQDLLQEVRNVFMERDCPTRYGTRALFIYLLKYTDDVAEGTHHIPVYRLRDVDERASALRALDLKYPVIQRHEAA